MGQRDDEILAAISRGRLGGTGWWRVNCPFCIERTGKEDKKASFGVLASTGGYHCFRCGVAGKLTIPEDLYSGDDSYEQVDTDTLPTIEVPEGFTPLAHGDGYEAMVFADARNYLRSRGIRRETAREASIGACYGGYWGSRIVVPVKPHGLDSWVGFIARDWTNRAERRYLYPKGMKRGSILFNHDALFVETDEPVIVVEGVFDALPYWPNAVACLGKPTNDHIAAIMAATRPVAVALDGDAWREGDALAALLRFEGRRAGFVKLPPGADPNSVEAAWLVARAQQSIDEGDGTWSR